MIQHVIKTRTVQFSSYHDKNPFSSFSFGNEIEMEQILKEIPLEFIERTIDSFLWEAEREFRGRKNGFKFYIPEYLWRAFFEYKMKTNSFYSSGWSQLSGQEIRYNEWNVTFGYENKLIVVHDDYVFTGYGYMEAEIKFV